MSQVQSDTKFMKKLKKFLKIKPRVKNINYKAKTGTKTPNKKFASFREDNKENQKLQQEAKDPTQNIRTYKRVTSKNKDKYSNQHLKKDEKSKNSDSNKTKRVKGAPKGYIKAGTSFVSLRTAKGKAALNKLKAKERAKEAARKRLANK